MRVSSGAWLYDPASVAGHRIPRQRVTFRYFLLRCYNEGRGKAGLAALSGIRTSTSVERDDTAPAAAAGDPARPRQPVTGSLIVTGSGLARQDTESPAPETTCSSASNLTWATI